MKITMLSLGSTKVPEGIKILKNKLVDRLVICDQYQKIGSLKSNCIDSYIPDVGSFRDFFCSPLINRENSSCKLCSYF